MCHWHVVLCLAKADVGRILVRTVLLEALRHCLPSWVDSICQKCLLGKSGRTSVSVLVAGNKTNWVYVAKCQHQCLLVPLLKWWHEAFTG